jgi:hypothetical protein
MYLMKLASLNRKFWPIHGPAATAFGCSGRDELDEPGPELELELTFNRCAPELPDDATLDELAILGRRRMIH